MPLVEIFHVFFLVTLWFDFSKIINALKIRGKLQQKKYILFHNSNERIFEEPLLLQYTSLSYNF